MEFVSAFYNWCGGPGFWQGGGGPGWHSWMPFHFGGIIQLLILGLIIYFTVRAFRNRPVQQTGPDSPEEILRRRYALGEIDEKTYKDMKADLK